MPDDHKPSFIVSIEQMMDTVSISMEFERSADADAMYDQLVSQVLDRRVITLNFVNARIKSEPPDA